MKSGFNSRLAIFIQGKEGERTLTKPKEVVEWKTEVVQQTEFMTRYFSYMIDVQEELSIVSAEVFVEFVVDTPAKGYLNAVLIWKDEDCRLKNQWWFKSDRNTKLQVPVHRWGGHQLEPHVSKKFTKWVTQPDLSQLMIMVEWTSDIQDDWPSLKTRILQFEDSSSLVFMNIDQDGKKDIKEGK